MEEVPRISAESLNRATSRDKPSAQSVSADACCGRQSARGAILDLAKRLQHQADHMRALGMAIPENFPDNADAALWDIVQRAQR